MKPQTSRQKQALETKQKIFSCAVTIFAKNSYENVTVQDICNDADVSIGAFYHHFKSKENILDEGYRLFDQTLEQTWNNEHPQAPLEAIHFLILGQARAMEDMGAGASLQFFKNQLSSSEKYILNPERFFYRTIRQCVAEAVSSCDITGDVFAVTEDILGVSRGIIYDWCLHDGAYALTDRSQKMLDMVLHYYRQ